MQSIRPEPQRGVVRVKGCQRNEVERLRSGWFAFYWQHSVIVSKWPCQQIQISSVVCSRHGHVLLLLIILDARCQSVPIDAATCKTRIPLHQRDAGLNLWSCCSINHMDWCVAKGACSCSYKILSYRYCWRGRRQRAQGCWLGGYVELCWLVLSCFCG